MAIFCIALAFAPSARTASGSAAFAITALETRSSRAPRRARDPALSLILGEERPGSSTVVFGAPAGNLVILACFLTGAAASGLTADPAAAAAATAAAAVVVGVPPENTTALAWASTGAAAGFGADAFAAAAAPATRACALSALAVADLGPSADMAPEA